MTRFKSSLLLTVSVALLLTSANTQTKSSPLTVEAPLDVAELTASDGLAGDALGITVAVSGNTVVLGGNCIYVGNPDCNTQRQGVAYVYKKPNDGWTDMVQTAELTPSDGFPGDGFGTTVAMSGDTIAITANAIGGGGLPGKIYVFVKPTGGWKDMTETAQLTDGTGRDDAFGFALAIDGGTIVAGAQAAKVGQHKAQGAAYVFVEPPAGWQTTSSYDAELTASDGKAHASFGFAVGVSGDTIIVGSPFHGSGEAYVFTMSPTSWEQAAILTRANGAIGDSFGATVGIKGNTIAVGATGAVGPNTGGVVDVFVKPRSGWTPITQTAELGAPPVETSSFGRSIAVQSGDVFVGVGGPLFAVFEYVKPKGGWKSTTQADAQLTAGDQANLFGASISASGHTLVAGAPYQTVGSNTDQGAAFVFSPLM